MVFIKANVGPSNIGEPESKFTVQYFDEHGNMTIRSGGTRAWRCNNRGALLKSPYSTGKDRRSIGTAGDNTDVYAVYPDYETGHQALIVMLRGSRYGPLTLREASIKYVKKDLGHAHKISKISNLDPERTILSPSDEEFERYWKAIEFNERSDVGREDFIEKWIISGVHKKHGTIIEYLVSHSKGSSWLSKQEALKLAMEGRLHTIIVHLKTGCIYLRPEFGSKPFELIKSP